MTSDALTLQDVRGDVLVIGLDTEPKLSSAVDRRILTLGRRPVYVDRISSAPQGKLAITAPRVDRDHRVVVLRFDQPTSRTVIGPVKLRDGKARVLVAAEFTDPQGKPFDPRAGGSLRVLFEAVDQQGRVVERVEARPASSRQALEATLVLPDPGAAATPYVIRSISSDRGSGLPFESEESRVVVVDPATAQRAPAVTATSVVHSASGRAGDRLKAIITIEAQGGTEPERRAFLEALANHPPVISVRVPGGTAIDTGTEPARFGIKSGIKADRSFEMVVTWPTGARPGTYQVSIPANEVGGVRYDAAQADARTASGDALQLLVVAHRVRTPRQVLFDSLQQQQERGVALAGDRLALELLRGSALEPEEFTSLGSSLRARLIRDDGSAEEAPLVQSGDRYTTEPRAFSQPGRLHLEVDVDVEGLRLRLDGAIRIEPVTLRLQLPAQPFGGVQAMLPQGAIVPLEVDVAGTVGGRAASAEEILEVTGREGLSLRWSLSDGTGGHLDGASRSVEPVPWRTDLWLIHQGDQTLAVELVDRDDRVQHAVRSPLKVVATPFELKTEVRSVDGVFAPLPPGGSRPGWIPRWLPGLVAAKPVVAVVRPIPSPLYSMLHLARVKVGSVDAVLVRERGRFEAEVARGRTVDCLGVLRPYGWEAGAPGAPPEVHVALRQAVPEFLVPRWDLILAACASGVAVLVVGFLLARWARLRQLMSRALQGRLLGAPGRAVALLGPNPGLWPTAELLVCRDTRREGPLGFCLTRREEANGLVVLAVARQRLDGTVEFRAVAELPRLRSGCLRRLRTPDDCVQPIAEGIQFVLGAARPR